MYILQHSFLSHLPLLVADAVLNAVCLFLNRITQRVLGWIFKKLKRIDSPWTRKELD